MADERVESVEWRVCIVNDGTAPGIPLCLSKASHADAVRSAASWAADGGEAWVERRTIGAWEPACALDRAVMASAQGTQEAKA